ncbi:MAG: 3-keto-disaccharide hydrolase [Cellvibrionaceae bacterium]
MKLFLTIITCLFLFGCAATKNKTISGTNGWNTVGEKVWSTSNGVLSSDPKEGKSYLVSPVPYKSFKLELEFWPDEKVNSGVFINCDTSTKIGSKNCYEANISDNHKKPEFRTGSIVRHAIPSSKVNSIGKWNKMVFTSTKGKVIVEINGVKTAEVSSEKHPGGYIGLQRFKNGVIKFKNILITPL